jgi:hypothetical protein
VYRHSPDDRAFRTAFCETIGAVRPSWRADRSKPGSATPPGEAAYAAGTDVFEAEARKRAFAESDALLIFLLKTRDPQRFNQKQVVAVGGDENAPPIALAAAQGTADWPGVHPDPIPSHMQPPPPRV